MGVPISVATAAIITLPTIALSKPPSAPGGGVLCVSSVNDRAEPPLTKSVSMIQLSQNKPKMTVAADRVSISVLKRCRRRYTGLDRLTMESEENMAGFDT